MNESSRAEVNPARLQRAKRSSSGLRTGVKTMQHKLQVQRFVDLFHIPSIVVQVDASLPKALSTFRQILIFALSFPFIRRHAVIATLRRLSHHHLYLPTDLQFLPFHPLDRRA
jgi:hypothetical protein